MTTWTRLRFTAFNRVLSLQDEAVRQELVRSKHEQEQRLGFTSSRIVLLEAAKLQETAEAGTGAVEAALQVSAPAQSQAPMCTSRHAVYLAVNFSSQQEDHRHQSP